MARAKRVKVNFPRTSREALDIIDRFLAEATPESGKLWNVMSATRGPDESAHTKMLTTIPIRRAAFPRTAKKYALGQLAHIPASFYNYGEVNVQIPGIEYAYEDDHFLSHVRSAAGSLDIL